MRMRKRVPYRRRVVRMPVGRRSPIADFLRYHVLVRVFDGDVDRWLGFLERRGGPMSDIRFVRLLRSRMRSDPKLIDAIRAMVRATPFWCERRCQ
jgi:hypothetical protein